MKKNLLALGIVGFVFCGMAHAEVITSASCNTPNPNVRVYNPGTTSASCAAAADYDYYGYIFSGSGTASASAQYGVLKASATSSGSPSQGNSSMAAATFSDMYTINAEGMFGKRGVITFGFVHNWTTIQEHDSTGYAYVSTGLSAFASNIAGGGGQHSFRQYSSDTSSGTETYIAYNDGNYVDVSSPFVIDIPFYFGYAFKLDLTLTATAGGGANGVFSGSYFSVMDAGHSAYWDGVKGITADDGLTVPWNLTSASGTNYNQSFVPHAAEVPEPTSLALFVLGAMALVRRCSDRR